MAHRAYHVQLIAHSWPAGTVSSASLRAILEDLSPASVTSECRVCLAAYEEGLEQRRSANQMMLDGVLNQFRIGFQTECLHDPVFVKRDGTRFHIQDICNFLHRLAFPKQLENLALPPSDSLFCNILMTAS